MTSTQTTFQNKLPEIRASFNYPLAPITYFKIGGEAEVFVEAESKEEIKEVFDFCQFENVPLTILGGASNVVVDDKGLSGVVMRLKLESVEDTGQIHSDGRGIVHAQAGVKTALLVSQTVALGYTGLEYFLGIPGTLGGATYNNGHYLDDLIGEHILRVEVLSDAGEFKWLTHEECEFGYDSSRFHRTSEIIVTVEFALEKGDKAQSMELIKKATLYRAQTQPLGIPSSGCIFQNTPNTPALKTQFPEMSERQFVPGGFLIDQAGLKGKRIGGVSVSEKHAAWFINEGDGSSEDVKQLIKTVKTTVKEKFGVDLHEEVFYLENNSTQN